MEPNNIENQIKEKLNLREIQPSAQAWDRLDVMLSVAETKKKKSYFNWWTIAASFVGFVAIGTFFYNQNTNGINSIPVVTIENKIQKGDLDVENKIILKNKINPEKSLNQTAKTIVKVEKIDVDNKKESNDNVISKEGLQIKNNEEKIAIVIQPNDKIDQIVNQTKPNYIDVEDLLASVEKTPKIEKSTVKINSMALLNEVDGELEISFREKALNTISKKYKEAKEALVNRNNQ
ncbi:MAG: hypothetical protein PHC28_03855 [Flavobacterium sp.]|uniref:hypothetical protein n=1 Tax=Flavobacterium sp. TaxID=239 RepID=UPI0026038F30|nr:hypothetical protein [Flavobacterium sp.]MDD5149600.1 hypothetical protein [Flavobacterium sp.]